MQGSQYLATQAFSFGQGTFDFVVSVFIMLYLLYFFLRDGQELVRKIRTAFPLGEQQKRRLQLKFTRVVRATVKGNVVVAVTQGALGGFIFWVLDIPSALLWAVIMAFLSLLPAVGAGIVWAPVAVYFLLSGMIWQGVVLGLFGVFVIGLVDNVLRPIRGQRHQNAGLPDPYFHAGRHVGLWSERLCDRTSGGGAVHVQLGVVQRRQEARKTARLIL